MSIAPVARKGVKKPRGVKIHRDTLDGPHEADPLEPVREARAAKSRTLIREAVGAYEIARSAYSELQFGSGSSGLPVLSRDKADCEEGAEWDRLTSYAACFLRDAREALASVIEALYDELAPPELQVTDEVLDAYDERPYRHNYPERGVVVDGVTYLVAARPMEDNDDVILRFEGGRVVEV